MKLTLLFASLALTACAAASAQTAAPTPEAPTRGDFASHKATMLAHLDQHIAAMTAMRNCVSSAATAIDVKACREQNRGAMKHRHAPA